MHKSTYGMTPENPVRVPGVRPDLDLSSGDPVQQHLMRTMYAVASARTSEEFYLLRLRCPNGSPVRYDLAGNVKGRHGKPMGKFDISCFCGEHSATVFLDGHTVGPDEPIGIPEWHLGKDTELEKLCAESEDDAIKQLLAKGIARPRILATFVSRPKQSKTAEAEGGDPAATAAEARKKIEAEAAAIQKPRIVRKGQSETFRVEAHSKLDALSDWRTNSPPDATIVETLCIREPKKGFLGIGKAPGVWDIRWQILYKVAIAYVMPCEIQAYVENE